MARGGGVQGVGNNGGKGKGDNNGGSLHIRFGNLEMAHQSTGEDSNSPYIC